MAISCPGLNRSVCLLLLSLVVLSPSLSRAEADAAVSGPAPADPDFSQYASVVTATRIPTDPRWAGASVSVLTSDELQSRQLRTVAEALRTVEGVDVVQLGGPGAQTSVFMRGAGSAQTLVLIDGVDVSDPSSFAGAPDLADLGTQEIERIEVVRGPASSLYGSSAIGGVINILTRRGRGPLEASVAAEAGTHQTLGGWGSVRGAGSLGDFALTVARSGTGDLSGASAGAPAPAVTEYQRTLASGRFSSKRLGPVEGQLTVRYSASSLSLNGVVEGRPVVDPNFTQDAELFLLRPALKATLGAGRWQQELSASLSWHGRGTDNLADEATADTSRDRYRGRRMGAEWQHTLRLVEGNQALLLVGARQEQASSESHSVSQFGPYDSALPATRVWTAAAALQDEQRLFDLLSVRAGGRLDLHRDFGSAWTYGVAVSAELPRSQTALRASVGTGFKAPTLSQLADPTFGNRSLKPERSRSFELGFEQPFLARRLRVGSAFFRSDVQDLVGFDVLTFQSINEGRARITGLESFAALSFGPARLRIDYTWMRPVDRDTGEDLVRRPRHKASARVDLEGPRKSTLSAGVHYVGARTDTDFALFPAAPVELGSYLLASIALDVPVAEQVFVGARVENLLGQRYEEAVGYRAPGLGALSPRCGCNVEPKGAPQAGPMGRGAGLRRRPGQEPARERCEEALAYRAPQLPESTTARPRHHRRSDLGLNPPKRTIFILLIMNVSNGASPQVWTSTGKRVRMRHLTWGLRVTEILESSSLCACFKVERRDYIAALVPTSESHPRRRHRLNSTQTAWTSPPEELPKPATWGNGGRSGLWCAPATQPFYSSDGA